MKPHYLVMLMVAFLLVALCTGCRDQTCADCVRLCKPFAVHGCYPSNGSYLSCQCDASRPAPTPPVEKP